MSENVIEMSDTYRIRKEELISNALRGEVSIYEKKDGKLGKLLEKKNTIVYGGRNWLLKKAFGSQIDGNIADVYDKELTYFGVGTGGGEPGNLLQAGASYAYETGLKQQVRLRTDLDDDISGMYAPSEDGVSCYYKKFSSVIIKADKSLPYKSDDDITIQYPQVVAEIRIDLSVNDACTELLTNDLNEAGLFVASPDVVDISSSSSVDETEYDIDIYAVGIDGDYVIYYLDTTDLDSVTGGSINVGDYMWVSGCSESGNNVAETTPLLIIDKYNGESGTKKARIVVEKTGATETDIASGTIHLTNKSFDKYILFSRFTFSAIQKGTDRELVFFWRLYF